MPFLRPTLSQIIERIEADLSAQFGGQVATTRRSVLRILTRAFAGAVHLLYGFLEWNSKQIFPDSAELEFLERWASLYGLARTPARYAEGTIAITGTNGTTVPAGTKFQRSDGLVLVTKSQTTIAGTTTVAVKAEEVGAAYNTAVGQTVTAVSPVSGMTSTASVNGAGVTGGVDRESDAALRVRVLDRLRKPPQGGAKRDYEQWAKEIAGVTRVWVKVPGDTGVNPGEVKVYFVKDGNDNIVPVQADLDEVQEYLDSKRPVTAAVSTLAPTPFPVSFTIAVYPNTETVQQQVRNELRDLLIREGGPGSTVFRSRIEEAISLASGEEWHRLTLPADNVTIPADSVAVLVEPNWEEP